MKKRVGIIGAGASGLAAIKICLEEDFTPFCMEQEPFIGGLWQFTPDERHSTVYRSTVINTSKEMMAFSDFPIPKEYPSYMHNSQILEYFNSYAKHFGLYQYIQFETKVINVKKHPDFDSNGKWIIRFQQKEVEKEETFDSVVVSSGHHWKTRLPKFEGMDVFQGKQIHSHSYKDHVGFENKSVVVVGIGNSGADVAVELSRHSKHVYLSTRSGAWILDRIARNGLPGDLGSNSRLLQWIPDSIRNDTFRRNLERKYGDLTNYGLKPSFPILSAHPTVNGELVGRIATGSITVHPNIKKLTSNTVIFDNGVEVQADIVIYCTGYDFSFPFLDPSADVHITDFNVRLYKYVFPPGHAKNTLAFIGLIQPWGAIMPISELQCRWAMRVFNGKVKLPSKKEMEQDIEFKIAQMNKRYKRSARHTIQIDYVDYMDEIAKLIGVYPLTLEVLRNDPWLLKHLLLGPAVPAQYRLTGPNAKPELAKNIIQNVYVRTLYPTRTRPPNETEVKEPTPSLNEKAKYASYMTLYNIISKL